MATLTQVRNLYLDTDTEHFTWGLNGVANAKWIKSMWICVEVTVSMDSTDLSTMKFEIFGCVRFQANNLSSAARTIRQVGKDMVDPPLTNSHGRTFKV